MLVIVNKGWTDLQTVRLKQRVPVQAAFQTLSTTFQRCVTLCWINFETHLWNHLFLLKVTSGHVAGHRLTRLQEELQDIPGKATIRADGAGISRCHQYFSDIRRCSVKANDFLRFTEAA